MRKTILHVACILFLTATPALLAQSVSGTLAGKVTNASGAAIPNAAITITNTADNQSVKVLSGPDGSFSVSLPPGTYRIDVETQGYKHTTQQNITLVAGPPEPLTITLETGPVTETVELRGHAPAIQTVGAEVGLGVDMRTLRELPVIDRNPQQLVQLQTGITPPFPMSSNPPPTTGDSTTLLGGYGEPNWAVPALPLWLDPDRNRYFSTNGQMPWNNLWEVDGVMNEEPFRDTAIRVVPDIGVQQMNVETAVLGVARGFVGGAEVTTVTPAGTNAFHGDLYEFWSGTDIRTRDFFNTGVAAQPSYVYNQPSADFGTALNHDKTFLYGDYVGTYTNGVYSNLATVPTAAELNGNFSGFPGLTVYNPATGTSTGAGRAPFPGGVIPVSSLDITAIAIAAYFPMPNLPGSFNNYQSNATFYDHQTKADGRIDEHINQHTSAFLRYGYTNDASFQASPVSFLGPNPHDHLTAQNAVADVTHAFSGSLVTDFRFGYNRYQQNLANGNQLGVTPAGAVVLGGGPTPLPALDIAGFPAIGTSATFPEYAVDNTFDWVWNWNWNHGRHNVKFGTDIRRIRSDGFTDSLLGSLYGTGTAYFTGGTTLSPAATIAAGTTPYSALASFLIGAPTSYGASTYLTTPTIRQTLYGAWIGDTIQITHRVNLDFNARYDVFGAIQPRFAGGAMFYNPALNTFDFAGLGGTPMNQYRAPKYDLSPRVGVAIRIDEKTVFRAGYGVQFFQPPYSLSGFMPLAYGTSVGAASGFAGAGAFNPAFAGGLTAVPAGFGTANGISAGNLPASFVQTNPDQPYVMNMSAQIQREFYYGTMLSVGYVGALGRHLPFNEDLNAALPGAGIAGLPFNTAAFGRTASTLFFDNEISSNYHSLQASLTKRFAKGVSFVAAYTYSKALGYTNDLDQLLDPFNLKANYGPLPYDRQSMLTISHLWALPFGQHGGHIGSALLGGWQVNGVFTYATGTPLTVTSDAAACNCPGLTPFANLVGAPFLNTGLQVLNPAGFATPAAGTFGDVAPGTVRSPGFTNYDLSLFKNFRVRDRYNVQLRGEAFNLMNTPHFAPAIGSIGLPDFGSQVATLTGFGRQINLGFRFMF